VVGGGAQVLCGGLRGKNSKLGARSGPRTGSAHLIPSRSDVLYEDEGDFEHKSLAVSRDFLNLYYL
jgi:hypothetical protein